jgi:hypothetical protein
MEGVLTRELAGVEIRRAAEKEPFWTVIKETK